MTIVEGDNAGLCHTFLLGFTVGYILDDLHIFVQREMK